MLASQRTPSRATRASPAHWRSRAPAQRPGSRRQESETSESRLRGSRAGRGTPEEQDCRTP
eukprot:8479382-Alexandrium_andersonii.AAC.1